MSEFDTVVTLRITVKWIVMLCNMLGWYKHFTWTCCFQL